MPDTSATPVNGSTLANGNQKPRHPISSPRPAPTPAIIHGGARHRCEHGDDDPGGCTAEAESNWPPAARCRHLEIRRSRNPDAERRDQAIRDRDEIADDDVAPIPRTQSEDAQWPPGDAARQQRADAGHPHQQPDVIRDSRFGSR